MSIITSEYHGFLIFRLSFVFENYEAILCFGEQQLFPFSRVGSIFRITLHPCLCPCQGPIWLQSHSKAVSYVALVRKLTVQFYAYLISRQSGIPYTECCYLKDYFIRNPVQLILALFSDEWLFSPTIGNSVYSRLIFSNE